MIDPQAEEWAVELQLPTREIGPREEPERYATRFIVNDGQWTPEEHEGQLHKPSQAWNNKHWNREAREAAERQYKGFNRSMEEWKNANHPNCAFADSASTVMCGAMISLTPCIAAKIERQPDLHEIAAGSCRGYDPAAQFNSLKGNWFSNNPSSKEGLSHDDIPVKEETLAICHVSRAGLREPCIYV